MFNPILVPLDGSALAECVLPHVIAASHAFEAKIMLLQVLNNDQENVVSTELLDQLNWQVNKTEAKHYLEEIGERLQKSGLHASVNVREGASAESIIEFSQSQAIKLIILSSHGHSGLRKWGVSSITHKIIIGAPTSMLIIRASHQVQEGPYRRILVPLDGSLRAENVLSVVARLARFCKSEIQIVHVVKTPEIARHLPPAREDIDLSDQIVLRNQQKALHYLDEVQLLSPLAGIDVKAHLIISNNAAVSLHELVEREQIDMLVLNAHGYSGNNQWPYGSIVHNFILYGKVPLLIVQDLPVKLVKEESGQAELRVREHIAH